MNFKTVETYANTADIIREYFPGDVSEEIIDYMEHINDFETFGFLVINGETVVMFDALNGYVYHTQPLDEFMREAIEEAKEDL